VIQNAINSLLQGGTIFLREVQLPADVTFGSNILIVEDYQGERKFYSNNKAYRSTEETADYIIFIEDGVVKAKNGQTGEIEFSDEDAATVIQQAIENGKHIYIKPGLYLINSTIELEDMVTIEGAGVGYYAKAPTILKATGDMTLLLADGKAGITIRGLYLDGGNYSVIPIHFKGGDGRHLVEQNTIRFTSDIGIYANYEAPGVFDTLWIMKNRIIDCGVGIQLADVPLAWIIGNDIPGSTSAGAAVYLLNCDRSFVAFNNIDTGNGTGLLMYNCEYCRVIGNNIWNFQHLGIYLYGGSHHNIFVGNNIYSNALAGGDRDNVYITESDYNTFIGNEVRGGSPRYQINLWDADYNIIALNNVAAGVTGIIRPAGTGNVVRHNRGYITENGGTATIPNGSTSVVVNHGCDYTPKDEDIDVHPIGSLGAASYWWVDTITSTQFTIHVNADPGQDVGFKWSVRRI